MNKSVHPAVFWVLTHFNFEGRSYRLNHRLTLEIKKEGEYYTLDFSPFDLYLWGETRAEVEDELYASLDGLWRAYALEKDENLTAGAKELKRQILGFMKLDSEPIFSHICI